CRWQWIAQGYFGGPYLLLSGRREGKSPTQWAILAVRSLHKKPVAIRSEPRLGAAVLAYPLTEFVGALGVFTVSLHNATLTSRPRAAVKPDTLALWLDAPPHRRRSPILQ